MCSGAFGSPQLLQLSGVGNAAELAGLGIDVVADLPGVGENLQDHLEVYIQYGSKQPVSVAPALKWRNRPGVALRWALARSGPGATNHFEAGGFARSNDAVAYPNLMFHFLPIAIRYDGSAPAGGHGYQVHIGPMYSDSRGHGEDQVDRPVPAPGAAVQLPVHADRPAGVDRGDRDRAADTQPARVRRVQRGRAVARAVGFDESSVLDWVARDAETALHPSCTCAMGTGPLAVTDPGSLRVHGVDGLRVVDASVMPYVTNGNIYAPVMMMAEKAADLIAGNTPLPPQQITFYRHNSDADSR